MEDKSVENYNKAVQIIPWNEIVITGKLGKGGYGIVYRGEWKHGGEVAIKQIEGMLGEDAEQELFNLKPKYSMSSDVYAYGMTSWELAAREFPYKDICNNNIIINAVEKGQREDMPDDCPNDFAKLIMACWSQEPNKRPTMDMVIKELEVILEK